MSSQQMMDIVRNILVLMLGIDPYQTIQKKTKENCLNNTNTNKEQQ